MAVVVRRKRQSLIRAINHISYTIPLQLLKKGSIIYGVAFPAGVVLHK